MDKVLLKISDWYCALLLKHNKINKEDCSNKDFVFRTNLYNTIVFVAFCLVGVLTWHFFEMVTLFLVFNILRDKCNGIHSYGNLEFCFIFSALLFVALCFTCGLNFPYKIISFPCIIYTFLKAPYVNEGYEEKKIDDDINKFDYLFLALLFWFLSFSPLGQNISNAINIAIIVTAIFMSKTVEKIFFGIRGLFYKL